MRDFAYKLLFLSLGGAADAVRAYKPTIFCFHSVTSAGSQDAFASRISVSDEFLERLILDLRRRGIAIVSLAEALSRLAGGDDTPFVVLTFDDGYADNYHN
jgi:peptidoglycan/xylan/chitin deacetylase (PgdA/CDA1 family)